MDAVSSEVLFFSAEICFICMEKSTSDSFMEYKFLEKALTIRSESVYNITIVREGNRKPSFFPCLKRGKHEMRLKRGVTHP